MNLSIVIPCKENEPRLMQTLGSIAGTAPDAEVILVCDGWQPANLPVNITPVILDRVRGTQYARHAGIMKATGKNILTCDAHMDFAPVWSERLAAYLTDNPDGVCCFKMCAMEDGDDTYFEARSVYHGASINWRTREGDEHGALVGKWADNKPGEISCVMGGAYGFTKQRYLDIGQPWKLGTGWGCDEETISAVNWLCGGRMDLLDHYIGHYMGTARPLTVAEGDQMWANRLRLLFMLPFSESLQAELFAWLEMNAVFRARLPKILALASNCRESMFCQTTPYTRTIDDWIERFELKPRKEVNA